MFEQAELPSGKLTGKGVRHLAVRHLGNSSHKIGADSTCKQYQRSSNKIIKPVN